MRILIWGGDSWANQGDAAVLAGTVAALRRAIPQASLIVASDRPAVTACRHHVQATGRWSLGFLKALWEADIVLWGGGQLLQNASSKPFLFVQLLFLSLALLLRKVVVCYGQGVGPVSGPVSRAWARWVLNRLSLITVRDALSAQLLKKLVVERPPLYVTADPSFCVAPAPAQEVEATLARLGVSKPFVSIAVRRWGHYRGGWLPVRLSRRRLPKEHVVWFREFCQSIAALADFCSSHLGVEVLFVPMCPGGDQEDDRVAAEIVRQMAHGEKAHILEEGLAPHLLKGVLGRAELVVAMRTHAGILAADAGAAVASISYLGKGEAFMKELGLLSYNLPIEQVNQADLLELVQRAWRDRGRIRVQAAAQIPRLRARAQENTALVQALVLQRAGQRRVRDFSKDTPSTADANSSFDVARWARLARGQGSRGDSLLPGRFSALLARRRDLCLELAGIGPGDVVADLGCGVGQYQAAVLAAEGKWIGLDSSREMLSYAMQGGGSGTSLLRGDLRHLPLATASASAVLCIGVLDHLGPVDLPSALHEAARVLQPGGRLVLTCNSGWWGRQLRALFPPRAPALLRGTADTFPHLETLPVLLTEVGLSEVQRRRISGSVLGPDTWAFLYQKRPSLALREEEGPCALAATTERS